MSSGKYHWPPYRNQSGQHVQWTTYLFFESVFLNLRNLPEHLATRYVILYACGSMVLDSNGPIMIQFKSTSLKQKQTA